MSFDPAEFQEEPGEAIRPFLGASPLLIFTFVFTVSF